MEHNWFKDYFNLYKGLHINNEVLEKLTELKNLIEVKSQKNKIYIFGNGGSASDSEHLTAELMIRYKKNRISIPSICLNSMTSSITACANDFGYESCQTDEKILPLCG